MARNRAAASVRVRRPASTSSAAWRLAPTRRSISARAASTSSTAAFSPGSATGGGATDVPQVHPTRVTPASKHAAAPRADSGRSREVTEGWRRDRDSRAENKERNHIVVSLLDDGGLRCTQGTPL